MPQIETALLENTYAQVALLNLGCITQSWRLAPWRPDRSAVLGYRDAQSYLNNPPYFGAIVGRVANRIAGARFTLNGKVYHVSANESGNTLHGGQNGISHQIWAMEKDGADAVQFTLHSKDGDQGFPANVWFTVMVSLHKNTLTYDMTAQVNAPTPINMTQHNYYNLQGSGTLDGHHVHIPSSQILDADAHGIPTASRSVSGGPLDFTKPRKLEKAQHQTLDAHYCFDAPTSTISLRNNETHLDMTTDQVGAQIYTSGKLTPNAPPFGSQVHDMFSGICIEPQGYPNALNRPDFPPILVTPDAPYRNTITLTLRDEDRA